MSSKVEENLCRFRLSSSRLQLSSLVGWPNGKALLSGGKDCGFESHSDRDIFLDLHVNLYFWVFELFIFTSGETDLQSEAESLDIEPQYKLDSDSTLPTYPPTRTRSRIKSRCLNNCQFAC